ncbi:MAG: hypothetical protein WC716_03135 [Chitinophagaceae bacterium]
MSRFNSRIFLGTLLLMIFLPFFALANHGVEALGEVFEFLYKLFIGYCIFCILSFFVACSNISAKSRSVRIVNIIILFPAVIMAFIALANSTLIGILFLIWIILNGWIISKSYPDADEKSD